jgi:CubicO group peptidase (beta-lactamase class C family)
MKLFVTVILALLVQPSWAVTCAPTSALQAVVDNSFAANPKVAGISVAQSKSGCPDFTRAVGKRDVVQSTAMTATTKMHLGSLSKPITAALIITADKGGKLKPGGLDSKVSQYFTTSELAALTTDCLAGNQIQAYDRQTGAFVPTIATCPDFNAIRLRDLLHSNDGNISMEELDVNANGVSDMADYPIGKWLRAGGFPTFPALANPPINAFQVLDLFNIYRQEDATIGGTNSRVNFPPSGGNTSYDMLGIIVEKVFGLPYNICVNAFVTAPLGIDKMILLPTPPSSSTEASDQISRGYLDTAGASGVPGLNEDTNGAYPIVNISGRKAVDVYNLDSFTVQNSGGGAGAVVTTAKGYLGFFNAYTSPLSFPPSRPA